MRRLLGVLLALARASLMTAIQYRSNFVLEFFVGAGNAALGVLPLIFVFDHAATLSGWTLPESLLVTAFFLLLSGLVGMFIEPNLSSVVEGVRTGALDYMLLRPVDAQLLASARSLAPARVWEVGAGLGVGAYALHQLPTPGLAQIGAAVVLVAAGLAAIYSLWVVVICLSFWFVRVDNLRYLLSAVTDAGRWPVTIYQGWVRIALTVVVPVAIATSYPALALLGRLDPGTAAQGLAVGALALGVSRVLWKASIRRYSSASS